MAKIRITKEFQFEMAHALWNYNGKCKNIHGHTYILRVTVIGTPKTNPEDPQCGMVMDFGELKHIIKTHIVDTHDHFLVLNGNSPHRNLDFSATDIKQVQYKNYQPTCENMVLEFVDILQKELPKNVELKSLQLYETQNSYAQWFAEDNE